MLGNSFALCGVELDPLLSNNKHSVSRNHPSAHTPSLYVQQYHSSDI